MTRFFPSTTTSLHQLTIDHFDRLYRNEMTEQLMSSFQLSPGDAHWLYQQIVHQFRCTHHAQKHWSLQLLWQEFRKLAQAEWRKMQQRMENNFGLSEPQFQELVQEVQQGNNQQFEAIFLHHFSLCRQYLIKKYKASPEDAYDITMDTLLDFHQRMASGKIHYGNLRFLFTQMASQHYLKWIKKPRPDALPEQLDLIEEEEGPSPENLDNFQRAWSALLDRCRQVLHLYYYNEMPFNEIADQLARSAVAVRKQKQRCLEKLRELFKQQF